MSTTPCDRIIAVLDKVEKRLVENRLAHKLLGSTDEEIENLERALQVTLPLAYRLFLKRMGQDCGDFMLGSDFGGTEISAVIALQESARKLLAESNLRPLKPTEFVFLSHQGYQFLFFDAMSSEDPPVYYYLEGEASPRKVFDSFTAWLEQYAEDEIALAKQIRDE